MAEIIRLKNGRVVRCHICWHKGINVSASNRLDRRPQYTCDNCGERWTHGKHGYEMENK